MFSKNYKLLSLLVIVGLIVFVIIASTSTAEEKKEKDAWKSVLITTTDLKTPYQILGTVGYGEQLTGSIFGDPVLKLVAKCEKEMAKEAEKAGADAIIGVQVAFSIAPQEAYLLMYGTAVKTTE